MKRRDTIDYQNDSDDDEQRSRNRKASAPCPLDYCDEAKAKDAVHFQGVVTRPEDPNAPRPHSAGGRLTDPVVDISTTRLPSMRNRSTSLIAHSAIHMLTLENKDRSTVTVQSQNLNRHMSGTEFVSFGQTAGIVTAPPGEISHKRQQSSTVDFKPISVSGRSTHFQSFGVKRGQDIDASQNQLPGISNTAQLNQGRLSSSKTPAVFQTSRVPSPFTWLLQPSKSGRPSVNESDTAPVNSSRTFINSATTQTKLRTKKKTAYEIKPDRAVKPVIQLTGVSSVVASVDSAPTGPESVWVIPVNAPAGLLEIVTTAMGAPNVITNDAATSEQSEIVISVPVSVVTSANAVRGNSVPGPAQPMDVVYQEGVGLVKAELAPNELQPAANTKLYKVRPQDLHPSEIINMPEAGVISIHPKATIVPQTSTTSAANRANVLPGKESFSVRPSQAMSPQPGVEIRQSKTPISACSLSSTAPNVTFNQPSESISGTGCDLFSQKPSETLTLEILENVTYPGVGQLSTQPGSAVGSNATIASTVKPARNLSGATATPLVQPPATTGQVSNQQPSGFLSPHKEGDPNIPIAAEITQQPNGVINVKILQAQSAASGGQASNLPPGQINLEIVETTLEPGSSEPTGAISRHTVPVVAEMVKSSTGAITILLKEVPDGASNGQAAGTSQPVAPKAPVSKGVVVVTPEMGLAEIISQVALNMGTAAAADTAAVVAKTGATDMRNPHVEGDHKLPGSGEVRDLQSLSAPVSGEQSIHHLSKTVDGRNVYRIGEVQSEPISGPAMPVTSEGIPPYPQGSQSFTPNINLTPTVIDGSMKAGGAIGSLSPEEQSLASSGQENNARSEADQNASGRTHGKRTGLAQVVSTVLLAMGIGTTAAAAAAAAGKGAVSTVPSGGGAPAMPAAMSTTGSGRVVPSRGVSGTPSVASGAITPRSAGNISAQPSIFSGTRAAGGGGIDPGFSAHSITAVSLPASEHATTNVPRQQGVAVNPLIIQPVASSIGTGYRTTMRPATSSGTPNAAAEGSALNDPEDNVEQVERQIGNTEDVEYKSSIADVLNIVSAGLANMMTTSSFAPTQEQTAVVSPDMQDTGAMPEQRFASVAPVKKSFFAKLVSKVKGANTKMEVQASTNPEDMSTNPRQPVFIKNLKGSTNPSGSIYKIADYGNRPPIVEIITGFKHYRRCCYTKQVLSNFNMVVPVGHLYGLIGPKKCGKTTVIKVVVRRHKLTFGTLRLFGTTAIIEDNCKMGYMTQQLGIDETFTMIELLKYYGQLLKLNSFYVNERIQVLASLLEIPRENIRIEKMNENNKRKISFALAVLHEPELLILDEPTAGADPVVRHLIWQHLLLVTANQNMTVLLTSHDLEEGVDCDSVGLMRNGRTLIQGPPNKVLETLGSHQLTGAFYILGAQAGESELDKSNSNTAKKIVAANEMATQRLVEDSPSKGFNVDTREFRFVGPAQGFSDETRRQQKTGVKRFVSLWVPNSTPSCRRLTYLCCRCYTRLFRRCWFWLLLLLLPLIYIVLFGMAIGSMPYSLSLGIVNEQTKHCDVARFQSKFSCSMLIGLDNVTVKQIAYDTVPEGLEALNIGILDGLLVFTYNERMISSFVSTDVSQVRCRPYVALLLKKNSFMVQQILKEQVGEAFSRVSVYGTYDGMDSVRIVPYGKSTGECITEQHVMLGAIIGMIFCIGALLGGWTMAQKHYLQIVDRLLLTGITLPEIYITHLTVWITIIMIQTFIMLMIIFALTELPFTNEEMSAMFKSYGITVPTAFCGIAFGILIFSIITYVPGTIRVTVYCLLPMMLLSGIFWPLESMYHILRPISWTLPTTHAVIAMDGIMIHYLPYTSIQVWPGLVYPLFCGVLFYFIAVGMLALHS